MNIKNAHRLLAPRPVFLLGTLSKKNNVNIIPITNVIQTSYDPSEIMISVYKKWDTSKNIDETKYCSLSPLYKDDLINGWKYGAKYSGWNPSISGLKLESISRTLKYDIDTGLPYLSDNFPVMFYKLTREIKSEGDHSLFLLEPYAYIHNNGEETNEVGCPNLNEIVFQVTQGLFGVSVKQTIELGFYK